MVGDRSLPAPVRLHAVVIAAQQPTAIAKFWVDAAGISRSSPVERPDDEQPHSNVSIAPTDASFTLIVAPTQVAKTGQNRIHFDLPTSSFDDRDRLVAELVANGARFVDVGQSPEEDHVVLADPEGNELCVLAPGNRFLAGCPRLGAVNCDGTADLGHFWSDALGWPLVWDQDEETAIQAPGRTGPKITWSGPPLMPRDGPERLHFHVTPAHLDVDRAVDALIELGAQLPDASSHDRAVSCVDAVAMTDPDGNPFCIVA